MAPARAPSLISRCFFPLRGVSILTFTRQLLGLDSIPGTTEPSSHRADDHLDFSNSLADTSRIVSSLVRRVLYPPAVDDVARRTQSAAPDLLEERQPGPSAPRFLSHRMAQFIDLDEDEEGDYGSHRCMEPDACRAALAELFPDMCPEFLNKAASDNHFLKQQAVDYVLDLIQDGKGYDKRLKRSSLKRKRSDSPSVDQEARLIAEYDNPARRGQAKDKTYLATA